MDKKRFERSTEGEPNNKTLKRNPLVLDDSFSKTVPQEIKCLICAGKILSRSETQILQDQASTVRLLGQLLKVLKLSPQVCQRLLEKSFSTVTVLYCEPCEEAISSCLNIAQEIDNLQNEWERISDEIKENIIKDNHGGLVSSGNAYIRKTLVQCWTTCTVRIKALPPNKFKHQVDVPIKVSSPLRLNPVAESKGDESSNNFSAAANDSLASHGLGFAEYSSKSSEGPCQIADKIIVEVGTPRSLSPSFSNLSESDKNEFDTVGSVGADTSKSGDPKNTETTLFKEDVEFDRSDTVNQAYSYSSQEDSERSLTSRTPSRSPRCHEQIVNYFCDIKIDEPMSERGLLDAPGSPLDEKSIACQDEPEPFPDVKPTSTKKTKRWQVLKLRSTAKTKPRNLQLKKPSSKTQAQIESSKSNSIKLKRLPSVKKPRNQQLKKPSSNTKTSTSTSSKEKLPPSIRKPRCQILKIRPTHRLQEFPLTCSICGKGYHQKKTLMKHEKLHELSSITSFQFQCSECKDIRFASAHSLRSHNAMVHKTSSVPHPTEEVVFVGKTKAKGSLDSFECTYCKKVYNAHDFTMEEGSDKLQIKCDQMNCDKTFSNFEIFSGHHCRTCLVKTKQFSDSNDNNTVQKKQDSGIIRSYTPSAGHLSTSTDTNLDVSSLHECKKCNRLFENATVLKNHKKFGHKNKNISCPECPEKFTTAATARNHQVRTHGMSLKTTADADGNLDSFQCVYCKEEFVKSSFIIEDNSTDPPTKKFSFPDLPIAVSTSSFDLQKDVMDFKSFHWNHRLFCKSRPRLASHLDNLDVSNPVQNVCKFCHKEFYNAESCRNHEISIHTKDFKFHCETCGRGWPSRSSLKFHCRRVHVVGKPFMCEKCPRVFKSNSELKNHMNMHNNIRPYICEHCGKAFTTSSILYMHRKQSHKDKICKT